MLTIVVVGERQDDAQAILSSSKDDIVDDVPLSGRERSESGLHRVRRADTDATSVNPNSVGSHSDSDGQGFTNTTLVGRCALGDARNVLVGAEPYRGEKSQTSE